MFLHVLKNGDVEDGMGGALSDDEFTRYNQIVSDSSGDLAQTPTTPIPLDTVMSHLKECRPQHAKSIDSASPHLSRLLETHAFFPFPTTKSKSLTPPDLLRAILLLTRNCEDLFKTAGWTGTAVTIRERTQEQRIAFVFSSLAEAPITPSLDDVLDVLCRIPYPRVKDSSGDLSREKVTDLVLVAERLLGPDSGKKTQGSKEPYHVSTTTFNSVANLVASLNGATVVKGLPSGQSEMDVHAFQQWAKKTDLLGALDILFSCYLR
ncbi:hypothetical protein K504DRAFT_285463 [Pleomassaria siparia CBS 279.74]|uniref:Uncharacterized protein n=1 Tax=Pleomassaria siparia CBS 279.74 TaxID=1314801 RepID=A0A6G1K702_9PLEO|nr:hypothetical protein K504DRAFT_285463 [Pleomassaria siparia CBS 279.74]